MTNSATAMTETEIEEIKARYRSATPGPWTSFVEGRDMVAADTFIRTGGKDIYLTGATVADQDFIAGARHDIARLIEEVERLRDLLQSKNTR
jgi:hypothetical protein